MACDPFLAGSFKLKKLIEKENFRNIYFTNFDFLTFAKLMKGLCFSRVYILFPDPWHKKKHNKRRLINLEFVKILAKITNKDSEIFIVTDDTDYSNQIIKTFTAYEKFKMIHSQLNKSEVELGDGSFYQTKYFFKAMNLESSINFFVVKK